MPDPTRDQVWALVEEMAPDFRDSAIAGWVDRWMALLAEAPQPDAQLPDGLPEDLYVDLESVIHQHLGHDGQSDETNDWVTDLMAAISPLIERVLAAEAPQPRPVSIDLSGVHAELHRRRQARAEAPPADPASEGATLLMAVYLPDCLADVDEDDAEMYADVFAGIVNEERHRNGGGAPDVEISAIPSPQWLTPETLVRLRAAASEAPQPRVLWEGPTVVPADPMQWGSVLGVDLDVPGGTKVAVVVIEEATDG